VAERTRARFTKSDTAQTAAGSITAKATTQVLAAANPTREELYVCNPSSKEVWLALAETAVKEKGIWLKKEGGSAVITGYIGAVGLITSEGEGLVTFAEV
jgi:hypothetical protein